MADAKVVSAVKIARGMTGTFEAQDAQLKIEIDEVIGYMVAGGVPENVANSEASAGVIARGIEDILVYLLLAELILLTYSIFVLCGILWWLWIHRQWRVAQLYTRVKDAVYDIRAKKFKAKKI